MKNLSRPTGRIILMLVLGTILGVFCCFIAIKLGYTHMKSTSLSEQDVKVLGVSIFEIQKVGKEYKGIPNTSNMMFIGVIFAMLLAIVAEMVSVLKIKKKNRR